MQLLMQSNCAVLITKHQSLNAKGVKFQYRSRNVFVLEASMRKVFKIKEFADTLLFLPVISISEFICSGQISRKTIDSKYPI